MPSLFASFSRSFASFALPDAVASAICRSITSTCGGGECREDAGAEASDEDEYEVRQNEGAE
eukprot:SAG22_NODE_22823_length_186_cov_45.597701_1_plen_61_part_11